MIQHYFDKYNIYVLYSEFYDMYTIGITLFSKTIILMYNPYFKMFSKFIVIYLIIFHLNIILYQ